MYMFLARSRDSMHKLFDKINLLISETTTGSAVSFVSVWCDGRFVEGRDQFPPKTWPLNV